MSSRFFRGTLIVAAIATSIQASAGSFQDDFSNGLNPTFWTVTQTTSNLYNANTNAGTLNFARSAASSTAGFQAVNAVLSLPALGGNITGDFSTQVDFSNAVISGALFNQVQLNVLFTNGNYFLAVHDNFQGGNNHIFNSNLDQGIALNTGNSGTFRIQRTGAIVSGFFNNSLLFATAISAPVSEISLSLQNNGTNDPISVKFDNFSLTPATIVGVPAPGSGMLLMAGLALIIGLARRRAIS